MTNKDILETAMRQSAIDANCDAADFLLEENKVVLSVKNPLARKYLDLPLFCNLISYGNNIVASVDASIAGQIAGYMNGYEIVHCFETPNLYVLNAMLQQHGMRVCFMAEYFLPDVNALKPLACAYETRLLYPENFAELYVPEWSNCLSETRKHLDVLGVGAYDGGVLVGMAGCSADCDTMWQIGVDVLPQYRRKGIASAVTSALALEIIERGKVPFYCCAWSNIRSARNAVRSGFRPAWAEMTAKSDKAIEDMNRRQRKSI